GERRHDRRRRNAAQIGHGGSDVHIPERVPDQTCRENDLDQQLQQPGHGSGSCEQGVSECALNRLLSVEVCIDAEISEKKYPVAARNRLLPILTCLIRRAALYGGVTKISRNLHVRDAPSAATEGLK